MFGRRPTASRTCDPTATGGPSRQSTATATPSLVGRKADALAPVRTAMPSASRMCRIASETSSSSRPISRGPFSTMVTSAPKRRIHLRELEADVAAADDDEMPRHVIEREHRRVREVRHVVNTGHVGNERAAADVDEDPRRGQQLLAHADDVRPLRTGRAPGRPCSGPCPQPLLDAGARVAETASARALPWACRSRTSPLEDDAVVGGPAGEMCRVGAGHQRLRRHAAGVDAGPAEQLAFDDRHRHAGARSGGRRAMGRPGRPR